MKFSLLIAGLIIATQVAAEAGRPAPRTLADACSQADLVLVATVNRPTVLPDEDSFALTKVNEKFTKRATISDANAYLGEVFGLPVIFGGKGPGGIEYRMESGRYFLLLKRIEASAYRAVDWDHSFMPVKDGIVEWPIDRLTGKIELISIEEAVRRITNYKREAKEAEMAKPRKPAD